MRQSRPQQAKLAGKTWRLAWLALLLTAPSVPVMAQAITPPPNAQSRQISVPGLVSGGQLVIDRWGIPHIKADTAEDAFFLQGWAVARDRLWQIDLWRKRGLGRLAAHFGPQFVEQDRASRLLLYRGDMAAEWAAYAPGAQGWAQAFVGGINAYIEAATAGRERLPEEFAATGTRPERWAAEDVVRIRSNALASNLGDEVARARAICAIGGTRLEPLRRELTPAHELKLPAGLDPCAIPADVLKVFRLGTGGVDVPDTMTPATSTALAALDPDPDVLDGSNNWTVSPARTSTGRPILAGDPHRAHGVPSLRYIVHMEAPGLHIAGAGEPALPGVSFGHNEDIGWSLTIFRIDQQDLILNAAGTRLRTEREVIEVKGEAPRTVELQFSEDGPVIHTDPATGRSFALRATWWQPGSAAYFQSSWLWQAKDWQGFMAGRARWGAPPLNLLYADTRGNIGWAAAGFLPNRRARDGLLPLPAGARNAWSGLRPATDLPMAFNPAKGWFATANEMNLPADYPAEAIRPGFEWTDRSRIDRIDEVLAANRKLSLIDAMALQADQVSPLARRAVALLGKLDPARHPALAYLKGWDGHEHADSGQAALFEIWVKRHLARVALDTLVPQAARPAFGQPAVSALLTLMEQDDPLVKDAAPAILTASLDAAWAEAGKLMGTDPARWRWGLIHKAVFTPDLAIAGREDARNIGPIPMGGSASTPMAAGSPRNDFNVRHGASVRMLLDVGAWDNSLIINAPGQSGNADSPHYRDMAPRWAAGQMVPFRWSREAVMQDAEEVIDFTK